MSLSELLTPLRRGDALALDVDMVGLLVLAICTVLAVGVFVVMTFLLIRYRQGTKVNRNNPPEKHMKLEVGWVVVPMLLSILMFIAGARTYYDLYVPPQDALEIEVVGKQWMWMVRHPGGRREINTLHVPKGVKVRLKMISQDVIHSFYLPEFRTKHDVLPGRYTYIWLEPWEIGTYQLACSEYCGTDHSLMRGDLVVMKAEDYGRWASPKGQLTPVERGHQLFKKMACDSCHDYQDGEITSGAPVLDNIYGKTVAFSGGGSSVVDDDYLRRSILRPKADIVAGFEPIMPTYEGRLSESDLLDLIAYLRSRSGSQPQGPKKSETSKSEVSQ